MAGEGFIQDALHLSREISRVPIQMAEKIGAYAAKFAGDTREIFIPTQTTEQFVESLQQHRPIDEAQVAVRALKAAERVGEEAVSFVEAGKLLQDKSTKEIGYGKLEEAGVLRNIGYGMLKRAVLRADESETVPDEVTQEVVFTALEHGAEPKRQGFLTPDEVEHVTEVFDKYDNTIAFPEGK